MRTEWPPLSPAFLFLLLAAPFLPAQTTPPLFLAPSAPRLPALRGETAALLAADLDGDGDLDLVTGNGFFRPGTDRLLVNDGTGRFRDETSSRLPGGTGFTQALAAADVDGDGDLDLVVGKRGYNHLYLNDGKGVFVDVSTLRISPRYAEKTQALALFDADGDKDPDLLVINDLAPNRLYLNDGKGRFKENPKALPPGKDAAWAVAVGDVDGDGDLDFVVGKWGPGSQGRNRLYLNDGKGGFSDGTKGRLPYASRKTFCLALGDVDGDGDLDLFCGNGLQDRLYLNDGRGYFLDATKGRLPADFNGAGAVLLADADGDGDLDVLVGNFDAAGAQNKLLVNDGKGFFLDLTLGGMPPARDGTTALAAGDLDGDGDLDLAVGNLDPRGKGMENRILLGGIRHTLVLGPAVTGKRFSFRVSSRTPDGGGGSRFAVLPLLGAATKRLALPPLGVFHLDPALMVGLPLGITDPAGAAKDYAFPVPPDPTLKGKIFYLQSLVQGWTRGGKAWRFTNLEPFRIL